MAKPVKKGKVVSGKGLSLQQIADRVKHRSVQKNRRKPSRIGSIDDIVSKALHGDNIEKMLSFLSDDDRNLFESVVSEIRVGGTPAELDDLWKIDYVKKPPTIEEFIEDDYWLGQILRPTEDSAGLFPVWKDVLIRDFNIDSRVHNVVVTGSLGIGKCHAPGSLIMMSGGTYKKVEDIRVGDQLMGDDSAPRNVLSVASGEDEMYEIIPLRPKNGPSMTVNSEHILCLKNDTGEVLEISVKDYLANHKKLTRYKLYRVPIRFDERPIKLDPYWLGLWIGDGSAHRPSITTADPEIRDFVCQFATGNGLTVVVTEDTRGNKSKCYQAVGSKGHKNPLSEKLRSYGLCTGQGSPKFIPTDYLFNSVDVRRKLLAGLVDSDGGKYCEGCYGIGTIYSDLADQITELARGLGYMAAKKQRRVTCQTGFEGTAWVVVISGAHDLPLLVPHKQSSGRSGSNCRSTTRTGFKVMSKGRGTYYGFEIDGNNRYVVHGHYVTHNTYLMCVMFLYRIVCARLLRNPQAFFNLGKGSSISYVILSVTKNVVADTAFGDIKNFMGLSPFFIEECGFNPDLTYGQMKIPLGNSMNLSAGSKGWHIIGRNAMGVALDEGNFRQESNPDIAAYKLYDEARTRIQNRFQRISGFLPAISILASSAKDESSFTEQVIQDIERSNDPSTQKIYRYAVYEVRKGQMKLGDRWFKVAYGLRNMPPTILAGWYDENGKPIETGENSHENPPEGSRVKLVPGIYHEAFLRDTKTNLQSICGVSTGGSDKWFSSTVEVEQCIELAEADGVVNPAKIDSIPISEETDREIWDFLDHKRFLTKVASSIRPKRHPEAIRFGHIDLATQGMAGIGICHVVGNQLVEGLVKDGCVYSEYRIVVEYDFILTIVAGKTKPISIEKIQKFFFWLRSQCGFNFGLVTADQWQCLVGSTLVNTDRGLIPISEVRIGDLVQSRIGPRSVVDTVTYQNVPTLKVETNTGIVIEGTPNHKIEACRRTGRSVHWVWTRLDQLQPGDLLHAVEHPVEFDTPDRGLERPIGKVSHDDNLTDFDFPDKVNPQLAEIIGLLYGDGHVNDSGIAFAVANHETGDLVEILRRFFGKLPRMAKASPGSNLVRLSSRRLVRWLVQNKMDKSVMRIPAVIMESSRASKAAFLRGLFSADGCVAFSRGIGQVSCSTSSRELALDVATVLRTEFGIRTSTVKQTRTETSWNPGKEHYNVVLTGDRSLFLPIGFSYTSKQEKFVRCLGTRGRKLYDKVKIVSTGTANVYDITVEGDPSYTANGLVSHNSAMPLQMMNARGFRTANLSLDRKKDQYLAWRNAFEELRLRPYRQHWLLRDIERLYDDGRKIDHPKDGSGSHKDTSDAAAGCYWNAITAKDLGIPTHNGAGIISDSDEEELSMSPPPISIEISIPRGETRVFNG